MSPWSPPKKSTLTTSVALTALGIFIGTLGALNMFIPFLNLIGVPPAWNVDGICVIVGLSLCGVAQALLILGITLRGV